MRYIGLRTSTAFLYWTIVVLAAAMVSTRSKGTAPVPRAPVNPVDTVRAGSAVKAPGARAANHANGILAISGAEQVPADVVGGGISITDWVAKFAASAFETPKSATARQDSFSDKVPDGFELDEISRDSTTAKVNTARGQQYAVLGLTAERRFVSPQVHR